MPTPLFFIFLQTTAQYGRKQAFKIAAGVWVSDWMYILLALWASSGLKLLLDNPDIRFYAGLVGGGLLITIGSVLLFQRMRINRDAATEDRRRVPPFLKGFLINGGNPAVAVFWLGVVGTSELAGGNAFLQALGAQLTLMTTDSLKILLSQQLGRRLQHIHLLRLQQLAGFLLILVGATLLVGWF